MKEFKIDILDYIGKIEQGILVLISIVYNKNYYEGTFYYDVNNKVVLTVESELEEKIGSIIEEYFDYQNIILYLMKLVIPVNEIITRLDDIDVEKYNKPYEDNITFVESDEQEHISPTQSVI